MLAVNYRVRQALEDVIFRGRGVATGIADGVQHAPAEDHHPPHRLRVHSGMSLGSSRLSVSEVKMIGLCSVPLAKIFCALGDEQRGGVKTGARLATNDGAGLYVQTPFVST